MSLPDISELTDRQRMEAFAQVQHVNNVQVIQDIVEAARSKCFKICVTSPSGTFSRTEQTCLLKCVDRFNEARTITAMTFEHLQRKEQERMMQQGQGGGGF